MCTAAGPRERSSRDTHARAHALQGGPGCASTFGAFYELGPSTVSDAGRLAPNRWAWNAGAGLLLLDQPLGTGYSVAAAESHIPADMLGMAADLYAGLFGVFDAHPGLQGRPLFITGEVSGARRSWGWQGCACCGRMHAGDWLPRAWAGRVRGTADDALPPPPLPKVVCRQVHSVAGALRAAAGAAAT